jgi:hypothetical protein
MPAPMSTPPRTPSAAPPAEPLLHPRVRLPPRVRRELLMYGLALLLGLLGMPFLIWYAGNRVLGPYTHGPNSQAGPLGLLSDFFLGLFHGSAVFWVVALGPVVLLLLLRLFILLVRALPPMRRRE